MTNRELYRHYHKRLRLCRRIMMTARNHEWIRFISLFNHYEDKLKTIDMALGHSTAGGGDYKSQLEESIKPERRNVGNYKSEL